MYGKTPWIKGKRHTEESKKKMREAAKGNKRWLGKKHSEETKRKMSEAAKKRHAAKKAKSSKATNNTTLERFFNTESS